MSTITTGSIAKLLWPGLNAIWGKEYTEHPVEYTAIVDVEDSTKHREEDQLMPGFGLAPIKTQGAAISYDTTSQGYTSTYTHVAYGLGFIVTREAIDDNQYEKKALGGARDLAFSFRQTKENVVANLLNRGFNSSYTGGDAKELLATDHPIQGGTFSNELATPADLSEAALEDICIQIMNFVNDRNMKISIMPDSLIVPPALVFEATRILKSQLQSNSANNDINAMRSMGLFPGGVKVNHFLTDTDAWFVKTNAKNGLKLFQRTSPEFAQDNDFDTSNLKYKGYERYSTGWSDPRGIAGSAGS